MPYTRAELGRYGEKIGRGWRTLQRWVARGCDLNDSASVQKFLAESERKKTNVRRYLEARGLTGVTLKARRRCVVRASGEFEASGNVDTLPPVGPRGAGATLRRLEKEEEEGHRRLQQALSRRLKVVTGLRSMHAKPIGFELQKCCADWIANLNFHDAVRKNRSRRKKRRKRSYLPPNGSESHLCSF